MSNSPSQPRLIYHQLFILLFIISFVGFVGIYYWFTYHNDPAIDDIKLVDSETSESMNEEVTEREVEVDESEGSYFASSAVMKAPLSFKFAENSDYEFYLSQEEGNIGGWEANEYKELFSKPFMAQVLMVRKRKDWDQWWNRTLQEFEFDFSKQEIPLSMFEQHVENQYSQHPAEVDEQMIAMLGVQVVSVNGYEADPWQSETAFHFFKFEGSNKMLILSNSNLYSYELCDANPDFNPKKYIYRGNWYFYLSCDTNSEAPVSESPIMVLNLPTKVPIKIYTSIGEKKIDQIKGDILYYSSFNQTSGVSQRTVDLRKIL